MDEVQAYLDSLPEAQSANMRRFHELIVRTAPELDVRLWEYSGTLIGYGTYPYSTKAGPQGDWFAVALAQRKRYISLYSMALSGERYLTESMADRFKGCTVRRSCINITKPDLVDEDAIRDLVRETYVFFADRLSNPQSV